MKSSKYTGELMRKGTHLIALVIPVGFILISRDIAIWLITIAAAIALIHDFLRIYNKGFQKFIYALWGKMYRRWEIKRLGGSSYILIGAALALFLFDPAIAALGMVYIIIGDTAAVFVGKMWGRHTIYARRNPDNTFRRKTLEGSCAFCISAAIAGLFIPGIPLIWKLVGALIASLVELLSFFIDDNFSVPIITGVIIQLAIYGKLMPYFWF